MSDQVQENPLSSRSEPTMIPSEKGSNSSSHLLQFAEKNNMDILEVKPNNGI